MNPFSDRRAFQPFPVPTEPVATTSDNAPTEAPAYLDSDATDAATDDASSVAAIRDVSPDTATTPPETPRHPADTLNAGRELYTLTVEDVAVRLSDENVYRDPRTIQRWCKSGKLDAQLDADKYLIEPSSFEKVVATLIRDRDRHARTPSRHYPDMPRSAPRQPQTTPDDNATHAATHQDTSRPVTDTSRDTVAAAEPVQAEQPEAQARIEQLETELAMVKADKQVREQMVDYLKDQFARMLDGALDRSELIGELRAENAQLQNLLDAGSTAYGDNARSVPSAGDCRMTP